MQGFLAAAAAAGEAEQKEREQQREQKKRQQEEAKVNQLPRAKRLKAQAFQMKFNAQDTDEDKQETEQHNREEVSSDDDAGDDENVHLEPKPEPVKGAPHFVVARPAKGGVKTISAKETRTEANRRGVAYQHNLVALQETLKDMYLHTASIRYYYRKCLEIRGPIVKKKKREAGRTEGNDLRETLGYALCCA